MNNLHPLIKKYYNQTKNKIPAFYPKKKEILSQIHSSLIQYQDEHSEVTYDDLIKDFGSPSEFADSLIEFDSPDGIRHRLLDTKKIVILSLIFLIIIFIFVFIAMIIIMRNQGERATETMITIEEEYIPETSSGTIDSTN